MVNYIGMQQCHIEGILAVERECFTTPWSENSFRAELANPLAYYIVALDNDDVVGYGGMWKVCGEGHVTNIAVRESHRRQGVGNGICSRLISESSKDGINALTLEVRKSNIPAQKMYEKLGFTPNGERKNYYDGIEDAILMWCNLM